MFMVHISDTWLEPHVHVTDSSVATAFILDYNWNTTKLTDVLWHICHLLAFSNLTDWSKKSIIYLIIVISGDRMKWRTLFVMSDKWIFLLSNSEITWLVHEEYCNVLLTEMQGHSLRIFRKRIFFRNRFLPATHFMPWQQVIVTRCGMRRCTE
jgi:hypothetical protein